MDIASLAIPDVKLIRPKRFADPRGYFVETYSRRHYADIGIACEFVQDNQSLSTRPGTIRGLHFQLPPDAQAKLVRVPKGSIFDVAVDIRRNSPSYGRWCGTTLTAAGGEQMFVPRGFAHGFCTLEPDTEIIYKITDLYSPECDRGLAWNDPALKIDWPVEARDAILSDRDRQHPSLAELPQYFRREREPI